MRATWLRIGILAGILIPAGVSAQTAGLAACVIDEAPWGRKTDGTGIYPEVMDRLTRETGLAIRIEITPLPRTLHDVEAGHCQFTITSWTESRADRVVRGTVFAELDYGLLVGVNARIAGPEDLAGKTVAWSRGLLIGEPYDSDTRFTKYLVDGYEQAMTMTEAGRVDAAVGSMVTLEALAVIHGTAGRFGQRVVLTRVPLVLQLSRGFAGSPEAAQIIGAIEAMKESGVSSEIIARHFARLSGRS